MKTNIPADINQEKTETQDAYYSEELSRAAVGRLFDDDDGPPASTPVQSSFVTGFDRATPRAQEGSEDVGDTDKNPTKKRERIPVRTPERSPERSPERIPEHHPEEQRDNNERFRPPKKSRDEEEAPQEYEDPPAERHRRREHATTRLLNGNPSVPDDFYDADRRERPARRKNPSPIPAVRVNVPSERSMYDTAPRPGLSQDTAPRPRPPRDRDAPPRSKYDTAPRPKNRQEEYRKLPNPTNDDLNSFRRRYNSDELFSPPRKPNRPSRPDRADVQTNRARPPSERERGRERERPPETVSPIRMIFAVVALAVLVVIVVLTFQFISFRNRYRDAAAAAERYAQLLAEDNAQEYIIYRNRYETAQENVARLEGILIDMGIDPDEPFPPQNGVVPPLPPDIPEPTPPPTLPTTHVVVSGDNLINIARRYFNNADDATLQHIMDTNVNTLRTRDIVPLGATIRIEPMPTG